MARSPGSHWNNRVVRKESPGGEVWYEIHEVYYNAAGKATMMTQDAIAAIGEDVADLKASLERMVRACDKPVFEPPKEWGK